MFAEDIIAKFCFLSCIISSFVFNSSDGIFSYIKQQQKNQQVYLNSSPQCYFEVRLILSSFPVFLFYVEPENGTRLKLFLGCRHTVCVFLFKSIQQKFIFLFQLVHLGTSAQNRQHKCKKQSVTLSHYLSSEWQAMEH